ncbi:hypothetical protein HDU99_003521, partial [Rhizoclosmatium hyalinum]
LKPGEYEKIMSESVPATNSVGMVGSIFNFNQNPPPPLPVRPLPQSFNQTVRSVPTSQPAKKDIDQVDFNEREKWVSFDVSVAESCVSMLQETLLHLPQNPDSDFSENDIAYEGFMRCCDIQGRIVAAIPKVKEPKLVKRLIAANSTLTEVMGQYNDARDSYWKRFVDFEFDVADTHQLKDSAVGIKADVKGKGKLRVAEEAQKETTREEFQKLEEFQLLEGVAGPSSLAKLKVEE